MAWPDPEKLRRWGLLAGIGPLLAVSVFVGYFAGSWLDRRLGTEPWAMVGGVLLGAAGGFIEMIRLLRDAGADEGRKRDRRGGRGTGPGGSGGTKG